MTTWSSKKQQSDREIPSFKLIFEVIREYDKMTCSCPRHPRHDRSYSTRLLISSVNITKIFQMFIHTIGAHSVYLNVFYMRNVDL